MRVAGADGEALARDTLRSKPFEDFRANPLGHAAVVHGDENERPFRIAADGECFRPDALLDALGFLTTAAVAIEPHRIVRREVHLRHPDKAGRAGSGLGVGAGRERGEQKRKGGTKQSAAEHGASVGRDGADCQRVGLELRASVLDCGGPLPLSH